MKLKRILSGIIGLPIVALILIFGNIYVIDIIFSIVSLIAMHEYLISILFIKVILSNMKTKITDIMISFFGVYYIVFSLCFIPLLYGTEFGKYLIWFIFISAWGTDTCAYFTGSKFGKHKISQISPKKSLEGCIRRNNWRSHNCHYIYIMYK